MASAPNQKVADLRELSDEDLAQRVREFKEELFNLRFQNATGQLDNNRRLQAVRRDIARIYTVMRERELGLVRTGTETTSA
jgi:large subunit ribosomal protein L29